MVHLGRPGMDPGSNFEQGFRGTCPKTILEFSGDFTPDLHPKVRSTVLDPVLVGPCPGRTRPGQDKGGQCRALSCRQYRVIDGQVQSL